MGGIDAIRKAQVVLVVVTTLLGVIPRTARGDSLTHNLSLAGGFDARVVPAPGGHGYGLLAYELAGLPAGARLGVSYNTDTARLQLDRIQFGALEVGFQGTYEFVFAGLLPDYFRDGLLDGRRGFNASFLLLQGHIKINLPRYQHVEFSLGGRRWFFATNDDTDESLQLPETTWVVESHLRYTLWWLRDDPSLRDAHRLFLRVRGVALGVEAGANARTQAAPFGALDGTVFSPVDPRNKGHRVVVTCRQWLRAGWQTHHRVRIQLLQHAGTGWRQDDLTRSRIGGMNPYVVPLAGAPWAALLADQYVAAQVSLHVRIWRQLEVGLLGDMLGLEDPHRVGANRWGLLGGMGVFADVPLGAFQIDIRAGWSPSLVVERAGSWNGLIALGWNWSPT